MEPFTKHGDIELYRKSCYIKKLLTIRRENRFTSQPPKESYWKDALSREEIFIIEH